MFRFVLVILTITVGVNCISPTIDDIRACMDERVFVCIPFYETLVKEMGEMTNAQPEYETICAATKLYDQCFGTDLLCGGEEWDYDCFVTRMVKFLEDANLCKDVEGHASEEETALAKNCLDYMVEVVRTDVDNMCIYWGELAKCFLTTQQSLRGDFIDGFRESTKRHLRYNFPHKFGNLTADYCPGWSSTYEDLLSE